MSPNPQPVCQPAQPAIGDRPVHRLCGCPALPRVAPPYRSPLRHRPVEPMPCAPQHVPPHVIVLLQQDA
eukprot:5628756-Prymnesium_polylepis.1